MHTIKLKVQDSIYAHVMFLLSNLNTKDLEIIEDKIVALPTKDFIDFSEFDVQAFKEIKDPLAWQKEVRSEWEK